MKGEREELGHFGWLEGCAHLVGSNISLCGVEGGRARAGGKNCSSDRTCAFKFHVLSLCALFGFSGTFRASRRFLESNQRLRKTHEHRFLRTITFTPIQKKT